MFLLQVPNIYSAGIASDTAYSTLSGTSMACPHIAGLAAAFAQQHPSMPPNRLKEEIINQGNWDHVLDHKSKNNAIGYNGC